MESLFVFGSRSPEDSMDKQYSRTQKLSCGLENYGVHFCLGQGGDHHAITIQHKEALAKCRSVIENRMGASAIYGDIGSGKTSLARRLLEIYAFSPEYNFALIVYPNYPSPFQLLKEIMREFGLVKPRRSLADLLDRFQEFLQIQHDQGKTNVLVLDESQTLKPTHLELIRRFLNFESSTEKFLQIVLFGQNKLALKLDQHPALKVSVASYQGTFMVN